MRRSMLVAHVNILQDGTDQPEQSLAQMPMPVDVAIPMRATPAGTPSIFGLSLKMSDNQTLIGVVGTELP